MALLKIISDEQEIRDCYDMLLAIFKKRALPPVKKKLDLHGEKRIADVFEYRLVRGQRQLLLACVKDETAYNLLAGIFELGGTDPKGMDFHFSIPVSGIERNHSCAFARDRWGNLYLVHRGLFFGGRFTFKRQFFFDNYQGLTAYADDGPDRCKVVVVGEIGRKDFLEWFGYFLEEVDHIATPARRCGRHHLDLKRRAENRAIVRASIAELNNRIGKVKVLDSHRFGLYQPRRSVSATATIEFDFMGETFVFESTLIRDNICFALYPRAKKRGMNALSAFMGKGFTEKLDAISDGEIGCEYDGSSVWFELSVEGGRSHKEKMFVEYTWMTISAVIKTLKNA